MSINKDTQESNDAVENNDAVIASELVQHPQEVPMLMVKGTPVKVNKSTLEGVVAGYNISEDATTISYIVDYEDEGEKHQRAFLPNQISKK